jgi:hypothetical protein
MRTALIESVLASRGSDTQMLRFRALSGRTPLISQEKSASVRLILLLLMGLESVVVEQSGQIGV